MMKFILIYCAIQLSVFVGLLIASAKKDRRLDDRQGAVVPSGFISTGEVSHDPTTGDLITVYFHPQTGKRFYKLEKE